MPYVFAELEEYFIEMLKYLETPECKKKLTEEQRIKEIKEITVELRRCLEAKHQETSRRSEKSQSIYKDENQKPQTPP
jgi:hypothetical protein